MYVAQGTEDSLCTISKTSASVLSGFPHTKKTDESRDRVLIAGSRDGAVVRELATDKCGPGSIPCVDAMCSISALFYSGYQQHATYRFQKTPLKLRFGGRQSKKSR